MKYSRLIFFFLFIFLGRFSALSQELNTEEFVLDDQITEDEKTKILASIVNRWQDFVNSSDLSNVEDRDNFLSIFDFDAVHYMDFKEEPIFEMIGISEYVDKAEEDMKSGLVFQIQGAKIISIGISDDFNFFAEVEFVKIFHEYIDPIGNMKFIDSGLSSRQVIKFSIDPYDFDKAYIKSINGSIINRIDSSNINTKTDDQVVVETTQQKDKGETRKKETEKEESIIETDIKTSTSKSEIVTYNDVESIFTASLRGSLGNGSLLRSQDNLPQAILGESPSTGLSYLGLLGLNLSYRRSVGSSQKLFLNFNLGLELGKVSVDITNFRHGLESSGYTNNAFIDNSARSNGPDDQVQLFNDQDAVNEATIFLLDDSFIENGVEVSSVYLVNFSPGLSYKIFESGSSLTSLLFDFAFDINYLINAGNNNITYSGTINNGYKIPKGVFPLQEAISALSNEAGFENLKSVLEENYRTDDGDNINDLFGTTSSNNLFFGITPGLTLQRKINYGFGFDFGIHYQIGLGPLYSRSDQDIGFLEGELSEARNASVVEQYYPDTKLNRVSLRIGLFFLLNQD